MILDIYIFERTNKNRKPERNEYLPAKMPEKKNQKKVNNKKVGVNKEF